MVGLFFANRSYYSMIEAINERRPQNKQVEYFGFTSRLSSFDYMNEFRTLYPQSKLIRRRRIATIAMFAGLAATMFCLMLRFE